MEVTRQYCRKDGLDLAGGDRGGGDKELDSRQILVVRADGLYDGLDMGYEGRNQIKHLSEVWDGATG